MKNIRISLMIIVTMLIAIGVIMIYSSSGVYAMKMVDDASFFLKKHLLFLMVGLVLMGATMMIDYRVLQKYAKPIFIASFLLLISVYLPFIGRESFGARRWINLFGFSFQPSEIVKITMLIYLADYLVRKRYEINSFWHGFMPLMIVLGVTSLMILRQPDLGTVILLSAVVFLVLFIGGLQWRYLVGIGLLALPALIFLIILVPYRMRRIVAFLDPWQDAQGAGFQLIQSQIALGSGGIFGQGLGHSVQKLFYLPAAHTDFILSIIGEEFGLIGTLMIVALFVLFIIQGARIAKRTEDPFGYYLALGIVFMIGLQALINIGVSIGSLPTKGLPLPFISSGGSSLLFNLISVGLLLNISRTQEL